MSTEKKAPIQTFRDGGIKINLWEQETKSGQMYVTANIDKSYRTPDGQWRNSKSFSQDDLAKLQPMLAEAQQEMQKWKDYYHEVDRQQNPDLPNPVQQQEQQQTAQQVQQTPQQNDMVAQRELVMSQTAPQQTQSQDHEHAPSQQHGR